MRVWTAIAVTDLPIREQVFAAISSADLGYSTGPCEFYETILTRLQVILSTCLEKRK